MKLFVMDYRGRETMYDVGKLASIESIKIAVVSGDEIMTVTGKDGTVSRFDSSATRTMDFYDGEYEIYRSGLSEHQLIENQAWIGRRSSYDAFMLFFT